MSETNAHANTRLEAFCDGVFAIALTLLVIELRLPARESLASTSDVWHGLQHLLPDVFAFVLSFGIILITWVNHHGTFKLVTRSSPSFIYANGFLLLTVAFIPFPTSLLGAFIWTDRAAPAVVLYNGVLALQAIGWLLLSRTALSNGLAEGERAVTTLREQRRSAYFAFALYALLAVGAFWVPLVSAGITTATWIFWLILSIRLRHHA
jgi:uncharacterized membrane protein